MNQLQYLLNRLKEPSTWAGLAVLATAINPKINSDHAATLAQAIPMVFATLAGLLPEAKPADALAVPPVVAGQ